MDILNIIRNVITNIITKTGMKYCIENDTEEIYVVFIINDRYTRWDIFTSIDTIQDMYELLKKKYLIDKGIIEINNIYFSRFSNDKLNSLATDSSITAKITTQAKKYYM
jgi:hypothetical protein